jgi:hypothetical protein
MRKRYRLILVATARTGLLVAALFLPFLLAQPIHISEANRARIEPGMSQREVETILGAPPGDYETGRSGIVLDPYGGGVLMNHGRIEEWGGDEGFIQVGFDEHDIVLWTRFVPAGRRWPLMERWLGRPLW